MDKITLVMFCYKDDENILEYSLKAANNIFGDDLKIALIDDNNNPISLDYLENLRKILTCEFVYQRSYFNRNYNLNGKECVYGEVDCFIKHSKDREGIVIKLDPDTIIFKRNLIDNFISCNSVYSSTGYYGGHCYMMKTSILEKGKKMLDNFEIPDNCGPEDYIIGLAMCAADVSKRSSFLLSEWTSGNPSADSTWWNFDNSVIRENIKLYYDMVEIICFGGWKSHPICNDKWYRIEPMKMLLQYQEEQNTVI